jgi:hypothetical protein
MVELDNLSWLVLFALALLGCVVIITFPLGYKVVSVDSNISLTEDSNSKVDFYLDYNSNGQSCRLLDGNIRVCGYYPVDKPLVGKSIEYNIFINQQKTQYDVNIYAENVRVIATIDNDNNESFDISIDSNSCKLNSIQNGFFTFNCKKKELK